MNRRKAISSIFKASIAGTAVAGSMGSLTTGCRSPEREKQSLKAVKPMLVKTGCQMGGTGKKNLEFLARHGVFHIDGGAPRMIEGVGWDLDDARAKKRGL